MGHMNIRTILYIRTTFCPFRTVTKSCPIETVPACPVQIRAHRHIAVYIDSNEQKCNQNIVDAMPALYAFALQRQVPVSDTFCSHSQHRRPGAVCLHTRIKLYASNIYLV